MVRCYKCKKRIKKVNLNKVFKLTLGNMENGRFQGEKTYYYHLEELMPSASFKIN